jgi:hypothetical protein
MMRIVVAGVFAVLLVAGAEPTWAGEAPCAKLPPDSLSRTECERGQAEKARQEERAKKRVQDSDMGTLTRPGTTLSDFACPSGHSGGVTFLSGSPGETVDGAYTRTGDTIGYGLSVNLQLLDNQNRIVIQVATSVFPNTLGPGQGGKFQVYLPHRNELSRPWDCYRVIVTERPPERLEVR